MKEIAIHLVPAIEIPPRGTMSLQYQASQVVVRVVDRHGMTILAAIYRRDPSRGKDVFVLVETEEIGK